MGQSLLSSIDSPENLKGMDVPQLARLARELREYILATVSKTGGHLAPSLGVVELTLVLHNIFDSPKDKIIWDVGHQAYAHKIITGRRESFKTIRQHHGISGFPKMSESEHDAFGGGHASTAISAALGMACARDLSEDDYHIIAVLGDGALTGGLAYEGLNNAGASGKNLIVILNDNSMSISCNVGAISKYLTTIISNPLYNKIKAEVWDFTGKFERMGPKIRFAARRLEEGLKSLIVPGILFERLGFRYFGPIDGHNIAGLIQIIREVKSLNGPIMLHVLTKKGKGFKPAEENAPVFHGLGRFDRQTGLPIKSQSNAPTYTEVFGETICELAEKNEKILGITAAMSLGTGLNKFAEKFPDRFFDVGIAEGHAVTFAAGLATKGYRPVVAIYSSFLQRGYDSIIHDVALQNLPVIFAIDRAGIVGDDGPTHHGVFDIAYLRSIPNMMVMVPGDEDELRHMLFTAFQYNNGPVAIRYPRGHGENILTREPLKMLQIGKSEIVRSGSEIAVLAAGHLVHKALAAAEILKRQEDLNIEVVNLRFVKPLDTFTIGRIATQFKLLTTMEEGVLQGGVGSSVAEFLADEKHASVELIRIGIPDKFVDHGNRHILLNQIGLSTEGIIQAIHRSQTYHNLIRTKKIKQIFKIKKNFRTV